LAALTHYGLSGIEAVEKREMIELILRGGPWSQKEKADLLEYCESDVIALRKLLPVMLPKIRLPYALLRGRFAGALSQVTGVPIDVPLFNRLQTNWDPIQERLITEIDRPSAMKKCSPWVLSKRFGWSILNSYLRSHYVSQYAW